MTRRFFILSSGLALLDAWAGPAKRTAPIVKVGVVSDSHVTADPASAVPLGRALANMSRKGVDVVIHAGDITDTGTLEELRNVAAVWQSAFPGGVNVDRRLVEPFFVFGNHDYMDASWMRGKKFSDEEKANSILYNKDRAWRALTGEEFPGEVFSRTVRGIKFVGAHWKSEADGAAWIAAHRDDYDRTMPVFYVQHPHPRGTCFGPWVSQDSGKNREALMATPNLFSVSGHSHVPISDAKAIWCGGFASMGAGSLRRISMRNDGAENTPPGHHAPRRMAPVERGEAAHSSIITVYKDMVVVERYEHRHEESLGAAWELPFPFRHDAAHPFQVADGASVPEFPAGAAVDVRMRDGKVYPLGESERQVRLSFPAAVGRGPCARAIEYLVTAEDADTGAVFATRRVLQDCYALSERRAVEHPGRCAFGTCELPRGATLRFKVTPLNAAGRVGRPIFSAKWANA